MSKFAVLAALAFAALPSSSALVTIPFTNCGSSSDHITISSAQANVWPPVPGQALNLVLAGSTDEDITAGTYEASVTFDWIPVLDKKGNINELVTLPLKKGPVTITKSVSLPSSIPSGSIDIHVTALDQSSQELICVDISANIGSEFPSIIVHDFGFASLTDVNVPFTDCGAPGDVLNITTLTASVWPPQAGTALTLNGAATLSEAVTGGTFEATVSYLGIQLIDKKGDLSSVIALPKGPGPSSISKTVTLPGALPSGSYAIHATGSDQNGKSLGCVELDFQL